jgi:hypothetical protein
MMVIRFEYEDETGPNAGLLLTPEEAELADRQTEAKNSANVSKNDAEYVNEPFGPEQCDKCAMFVPGFPDDPGGYCTKVYSIRGPMGMIFSDGWCKYFEAKEDL